MSGRIYVVASEKGGAGKTTIATNLAAMRAIAGFDVLLVDTDPQGSATKWARVRRASEKPLETITCVSITSDVGKNLVGLAEKYGSVVVDVAGTDDARMREAIAVADVLLVPTKPVQFDTWTLMGTHDLLLRLAAAGVRPRTLLLLNGMPTNPKRMEMAQMRGLTTAFASTMQTLDGVVSDRVSFQRAPIEGRSVAELSRTDADPKALAEIQAVYDEVFK